MDTVLVEPVVVVCRACGQRLSEPVRRLSEKPTPERSGKGWRMKPTLPGGRFALDPNPVVRQMDGTPKGTLNCIVLNPSDGAGLTEHPDPDRNSGCCGHDGLDGPNQRCSRCLSEVATLRDDCWSVVELRYEPDAIDLVPAS